MKTLGAVLAAAIIGIPAAVVLSAQARDGDSAISRELVNEMRSLRLVIERYAEGQMQTQALTSLMDVQQRRLAEANARLDVVRRELDATTLRHQDTSRRLAAAEQMTPEEMLHPSTASPTEQRRVLEGHRSHMRTEFEAISAQLQQHRTRESEALHQLAAEEAKWNELVGRLDQWMRR
jgi:hypothetical protein